MLNRREDLLYAAQQLSKWRIEQRISPEEIVNLHAAVIKKMVPDVPQAVVDSFDMLIEIMMGYGIAYREHESLVHRQQELEYEIEVAVGMQQTLLPETLPTFPGIDIGVISVPANKMSGDYLTAAGFEEPAGYGVVNAYAQWRPQQYENVVVQLNVDNLFDKTYYERSSYVANSERGGGIRPIYAPGRTVSLGVTVDF